MDKDTKFILFVGSVLIYLLTLSIIASLVVIEHFYLPINSIGIFIVIFYSSLCTYVITAKDLLPPFGTVIKLYERIRKRKRKNWFE